MSAARAEQIFVVNAPLACDHRHMVGTLVGREAELQQVAEAVVSARGGTSRCLLVTGEAGIGKSRLVAEALADLDDALVLTGHAVHMSTGEIPFGVVADTLRDLVRVAGADVLLPVEREALAPLLPGAAPRVAVERVQLLSTFLDLLERLASARLVVWVVEDLHWADSATRDLVSLAARTLPSGLLLVAPVRTDDPERSAAAEAALTSYVAGLARTPGCEVLPVSRLSPTAVQQQLRELLGSTPAADVATRVERLSDGIPFVVEELVAAAGRPDLSTVAAVASGRLGGLAPEARRLVEAAAVGDGHLRISLLEQVLDMTSDELDDALVEALRAGVLTTDHETDSVGFRHALLREATDRELGPGARRSWHRRWAEVLEQNPGALARDPALLAIAEHWHQARDVRRALAATVAALPAAARIGRPDEETALWTRVLAAFAQLDDAEAVAGFSLREAYARALVVSGAASHPVRRACLTEVPEDQLSEPMRLVHAAVMFDHGKGEANAYAEDRLVAIADAFEDSEPDLMAINAWANTGSLMTEDLARGERMLERARAAAAAIGDDRTAVLVESRDSYRAQVNGDPERAAARLRAALDRLGHTRWDGVFHLWGNLVWCELICGRHREAQQAADEALGRLTHPHLSVNVWEHLVENATMSWVLTGQWRRARDLLEESAPWWEDDLRTSNAHLDALDLLQTGRVTGADRWRTQLETPAPGGAPVTDARGVLALAAAASGDLAAMRAELAPLWTMDRMLMYDDQLWWLALRAARAEADAAAEGQVPDPAAALEHLETIEAAAARFRRYGPLGEVWPLDLAAQLDRFHGRDARPALRAALEGWERIGHVPDVAVTHLSLAEQEAIHGDRSAAREHLVAGREIALRLEAQPSLARADALAETYALTARQRRTSEGLTDREAEVLGLVAEGLSNGEIGARLFMSPKTASVHVSHILAKLGATNRTEAASIARRQGLLAD
jgi:DNA-binding CsgD family transcriptional regulator